MDQAKAVVLGGSGFIGKACARALRTAGFQVVCVSRSRPDGWSGDWVQADIAGLSRQGWAELLADADIVVNAAGALQDGARDSLKGVHVRAVEGMVAALQGRDVRVVQISAAGASTDADSAFFRTKAEGDAFLMEGHDNWVVLRPALVIGAEAYGGTALLRAHAGFPGISWTLFDGVTIQTVGLRDVAEAVVACAMGEVAAGVVADLAESEGHGFGALSEAVRDWQGFTGKRVAVALPGLAVSLVGRLADVAGRLGWRSPLRTTALRVMRRGILADTSIWLEVTGRPLASLDETLSDLPAHAQERWFARMYLLLPLAIVVLSLFWIASGLVGVWQVEAAMEILTGRGWTEGAARLAVLGGSLIDVGLGVAILWRRWARRAALGMVLVSLGYMGGSLLFAPALWLDPLGPMVKVLPAMLAAFIPLLFLEER